MRRQPGVHATASRFPGDSAPGACACCCAGCPPGPALDVQGGILVRVLLMAARGAGELPAAAGTARLVRHAAGRARLRGERRGYHPHLAPEQGSRVLQLTAALARGVVQDAPVQPGFRPDILAGRLKSALGACRQAADSGRERSWTAPWICCSSTNMSPQAANAAEWSKNAGAPSKSTVSNLT